MEVKLALQDPRFRDSLPIEFQDDVAKFLSNPTCACNVPIYRKVLKNCAKQLIEYFPGNEITNEEVEIQKLSQNHWTVINCHVSELEAKLRALPPGRKQIAPARYGDQVTVVVNELDVIF
jgi:hypothetical protein